MSEEQEGDCMMYLVANRSVHILCWGKVDDFTESSKRSFPTTADNSFSLCETTWTWVNVGAKESVRPTHGLPRQEADISYCRVEAGAEAVSVGVVTDQFAQTTRKCPKQMRSMSNTTMK